jgi:energy-coupling factor transport system ATP-binding protein
LTLCLDGLIPHLVEGDYEGKVTVAGMVVRDHPVHLLAQETGLVFQDPDSQFCTLTVADEVAFGLENLRRPLEAIEEEIDRALALVGLAGYRERRLDSLSGGEKQRVALAAVLAMGPRLLVLDEPSANLDPRATAELFALLRQLAAGRRHTLLIIEHKLDQIVDWVDSVLVLGPDGRLLCHDSPQEVFYGRAAELEGMGVWRPQTTELIRALRGLGWEVPGSPLSVDAAVPALLSTPGLSRRLRVSSRDGSLSVAQTASAPPQRSEAAVVWTRSLSYRYSDGYQALRDVTLSLVRGSFTAIAGANGAGKTTLAGLLAGVREAPRGQVFLEGADIAELPSWAVSERIGLVFQNPEHQFVTDTVFGELAYSLAPRAGRRRPGKLSAEQERRVKAWLERLGLLPLADANPFTLSQGQKRRLSVGSMLIRGQSALILDEPTLGQDELQANRLMEMMQSIRCEGCAVGMITHDMRLVAENADALVVLHGGQAIFTGAPADFFGQPTEVQRAGLAMPTLGEIGWRLHHAAGAPSGLSTLDGFVRCLGSAGGAGSVGSAGGAGGGRT